MEASIKSDQGIVRKVVGLLNNCLYTLRVP